MGIFVAVVDPPDQNMADYGCHRLSGLATSGPLYYFFDCTWQRVIDNRLSCVYESKVYVAAFIGMSPRCFEYLM